MEDKRRIEEDIFHFTKLIENRTRDADLDYLYYARGYNYLLIGQYNKAIADYTKLIELNQRLADAYPANDGRQTPMRNHPVFIAQHATGTCCRKCLEKWPSNEESILDTRFWILDQHRVSSIWDRVSSIELKSSCIS